MYGTIIHGLRNKSGVVTIIEIIPAFLEISFFNVRHVNNPARFTMRALIAKMVK